MVEKCIWKELLSGGNKLYRREYYLVKGAKAASECEECKGYGYPSCKSYLSSEEIERRRKDKELEDIIRSEK